MAKFIKKLMAEEIRDELADADNVFVVGLLPMDAENDVALRAELRDLGARFRVIHNRTSQHALDEARAGLAEYFKGQTALTLAPGEDPDVVGIAKAVVDAAKKKRVEVRGGYVDGELLDKEGVEALAQSPDKNTLRGMLLGGILAPGRGLAVAMNAVGGGLARCIQARVDEGGEGSADDGEAA